MEGETPTLSHLREHKLKHGLQDSINPLCSCGNDIESKEHFLHYCRQLDNERRTLQSTSGSFNYVFVKNTSNILTQTLLFGNISLRPSDRLLILQSI